MVLLLGCLHSPPTPSTMPPTTTPAAWLEGCWAGALGEGLFQECWAADGPTLSGTGVFSNEVDGVTSTEQLRIVDAGAGLVYVATPSDQAQTEFVATVDAPGHLRFENPSHDFPQTIDYQLVEGQLRVDVRAGTEGFTLMLDRVEE